MKIYTRTGDDGTTGLIGSGRVRKSDPRVEAYGSVDELNAALGAVLAHDAEQWFGTVLAAAQSRLFVIGARLATVSDETRSRLEALEEDDIAALERAIDALDGELPPLAQFILPGGTVLAAELHRARTVCRRAERRVVSLAEHASVDEPVLRYLNRLADLLFVMARAANHRAGSPETPWRARPRG
jgi:cob(I)alamin adenosyltransferase